MTLRFQPDDIQIHFELPPRYTDLEYVAIDSEFFGQTLERLHRPHGRFACVGCTSNGVDVYMIFDPSQIQEFYNRIDDGMHLYHNAQYDIRQLRRFANIPDRKKLWDAMLIEQIRYRGYYDSFALNDLVRRYTGIYMPKDVRDEFSDDDQTEMTDDQIFYAACDIVGTWMVGTKQISEVDEDDTNVWKHIELPFLWTLLDSNGPYFDVAKWEARYTEDARQAAMLDESIPFNPRSPKQVKEYFKQNFKVTLDGTSEGVLNEYLLDKYGIKELADTEEVRELIAAHKDVAIIVDILTARGLSKASKTYGCKWVDAVESDGRIYPSWKQIGAETGRMSCSGDIPIQTMPHDKKYRECIIAAPDHQLCICDYSSQEPRLLAYITNDPTLIRIFQEKKDVYIEVGYVIFGERFDKKDPRRQQMKAIILGISYGMSKYGLAGRLGVSVDEAEELLDLFYHHFPTVKKWVDSCAKWKPYTTTILGRKFWGNPYSNGWERNYQNFPMQGSAVDCTKIAAAKLRKKLGYNPCEIYMHDELVCEFSNDNLEEGSKLMEETMVEVQEWMHPGIPGGVEKFIGNDWSAKK